MFEDLLAFGIVLRALLLFHYSILLHYFSIAAFVIQNKEDHLHLFFNFLLSFLCVNRSPSNLGYYLPANPVCTARHYYP